MKTIIKNGKIAAPQGWLSDHDILIEDDKISRIFPTNQSTSADHEIDAENHIIAAGFIDLHTHGAVGYNFISANHEQLDRIGTFFARSGVTRYVATLMESGGHDINDALARFSTYQPAGTAAMSLGVHLEGPFLSPDYPGDMGSENVRLPDPHEYLPWLESGLVKMITVAPELPGSRALIRTAKEHGITVSIGHGAPNDAQTNAAFDAGATQISHMFNQMLGLDHHQAGLVDAALLNDSIALQIIADEDHLHPVTMQVLTKLKQPEKLILITDGTEENGATQIHLDENKEMPGMLSMDQAVRNILQYTKTRPIDALKMANTSPATSIGLGNQLGVIQPDASADLVILDEHYRVQKTIINGNIVYEA